MNLEKAALIAKVAEYEALSQAVIAEQGNLKRAAKRLGLPLSSLRRAMERHEGLAEKARKLRVKATGHDMGRPWPKAAKSVASAPHRAHKVPKAK